MPRKIKIKFDFVTIASHQLRTPLSAMKWFLEMLLSGSAGKLTRRQHGFINEIYQSNERMIRLVADLLIVSRIEQKSLKMVCRPFVIEEVIAGVMKGMKPLTDAARITVVTKFDSKKKTEINGDEDKIRQVVRTLMDNAIRYMIDGGLVIIKCASMRTSVTMQVQDTGVGIPAKERSKVFQQFYRGSNVVRMRTDGSGLGLYISKAIVTASGGTISVNSTEGKGSLFSVTLPLNCAMPQDKRLRLRVTKPVSAVVKRRR